MDLTLMVGIDTETIPNMNMLQAYQDKQIKKINSNKTLKDSTKESRIGDLKFACGNVKKGLVKSKEELAIIKDMSVDPLLNKIVAIGLSHFEGAQIITTAFAGDDEKKLLVKLINWINDFQFDLKIQDIVFCGMCIRTFDIPSVKRGMIQHNLVQFLNLPNRREYMFGIKKYDSGIIELSDMYSGTLDTMAQSILGDGKITDGSKVYEMAKNNEWNLIEEYVGDDSKKHLLVTSNLLF